MKDHISILNNVRHIGFCADIHSHLSNLLRMVNKHPEVKNWFCAGDVVDIFKPLHDNQPALRAMNRLNIPSVTGNHDYVFKKKDIGLLDDEAKKYLLAMPFTMKILFNNIKISIYHATPKSRDYFIPSNSDEQTYISLFKEDDADVFVLGHTHFPYQKVYQDVQYINPGALGVPEEVLPSYCIMNSDGSIKILNLQDT